MRIIIKTAPEGLQIDIPDEEIKSILRDIFPLKNQTIEAPMVETRQTNKTVLTVKEAAELLSIKENTIYCWALQKRIPSVKIGRNRRFIRKDLIEWFEKCKNYEL